MIQFFKTLFKKKPAEADIGYPLAEYSGFSGTLTKNAVVLLKITEQISPTYYRGEFFAVVNIDHCGGHPNWLISELPEVFKASALTFLDKDYADWFFNPGKIAMSDEKQLTRKIKV